MARFGPRDNPAQSRKYSETVQKASQRSRYITLVREYGVLNTVILRDEAELQGGGADINPECLLCHSPVLE